METNRCLICCVDFDSSSRNNELSSENATFLSKDLHAIFVLRNLFEVPHEKLENYLKQNGNPSDWNFLTFCKGCSEAVGNAKRIYQEILEASRIFAAVKGEIVEKVKRSWRKTRKTKGAKIASNKIQQSLSSWADDNITAMMIEDTREFIFNHEYGDSSDPFPDGDMIATDLLCLSPSSPETAEYDETFGDVHSYFNEDSESPLETKSDKDKEVLPVKVELGTTNLPLAPNDMEVDIPPGPASMLQSILEESIKEQSTSFRQLKKACKEKLVKDEPRSSKSSTDKPMSIIKNNLLGEYSKSTSPIKGRCVGRPKKHIKETSKEVYKCKFKACGRVYNSLGGLKIHERVHLGEKPFQCPWPDCSWKFARADVFRRHFKHHLPEKAFKCQFCSHTYHRKDNYKRHLEAYHREQISNNVLPSPLPIIKKET